MTRQPLREAPWPAQSSTPRAERRLPLTAAALYRAVLLAALLVVAGLLFKELVTLVLLTVMTVIVALPLSAITTRLAARGVPRSLGAPATMIAGLALLGGVVALLIPPFVTEVNHFVDALPRIVEHLLAQLSQATGAQRGQFAHQAQQFAQGYTDHPVRLLGPLASIGLGVVGAIAALVVMLITAVYIAVNPHPLVEGGLRLVPPERRAAAAQMAAEVRVAWLGWLRGLAVATALIGVFVYVGLRIVGLEFPLFFAVLSALFEVVPFFGALASGAPAVLLGLTHSPGTALAVLAVFVLAHQLDGNVISPLVMARAVRLHPAVVALGVVATGELFGVLGLIVSVPLLSAFTIAVKYVWVLPRESDDPA
jgi:predicted PurR-regulated permease PerM